MDDEGMFVEAFGSTRLYFHADRIESSAAQRWNQRGTQG
jgi:hypothetical protein